MTLFSAPPVRLVTSALLLSLWGAAPATAQTAAPDENVTRSHGVSVFGTPALPADFAHFDWVNPDAPKGGYISLAIPNSSNFDNFNPYTVKGRPAAMSSAMLETLLTDDLDSYADDYCLLCETLEYPESRDWVIFHMRPEARFADGSKLTAADVLFSYEILREQAESGVRLMIQQQIAKAEMLDDYTVRFFFTEDASRREAIQLAGSLPVFSRADFQARGLRLDETMDKPLLGSGPYSLTDWSHGRWVEVTRNPDYWGADLPVSRGRYNFDTMRYVYFADANTAFESFTAGDYTMRQEVSSVKWATSYNFPALKKGWVKAEAVPSQSPVSGQGWAFNLRRPHLQDIRVREAIGLMFNFAWTNENQFYGLYERVQSFWENSDLEATGTPDAAERALLEPLAADLPEGILDDPAFVWPEGSSQPRDRAQQRRASALLDEAGWAVGADGLRRNGKGEVLRLEILNDSDGFNRIIDPFVDNLRSIGIDAVNLRVDNAEAVARERAHDFDMTSGWYGQAPIPGADMKREFGSDYATTETNSFGLTNPAIDALIAAVESASTEDELKTATHALDRALRALRIWVPQWYNSNHLLGYYDMYGRPEKLPRSEPGILDLWWFDAEKEAALKSAGALN